MRWDDIEILQRIDTHQSQRGGAELWDLNGKVLMEEIAGRIVAEGHLQHGFVRELHNLRDAELLRFRVDAMVGGELPRSDRDPYFYLQQVRHYSLTTTGQDRARGRFLVQPPPDPSEDDGRAISRLVLADVVAAIEKEYRIDQIVPFLRESGIPLDRVPMVSDASDADVNSVLESLDRWGSEGRRILRTFLASWLDDRLHTGPESELRVSLIEQLARQGWYINGDRLIVGEPAAGRRVTSPVLREARLASLHPQVRDIAARYIGTGHRAEAVFESMKAVVNRVKDLTGLDLDGVPLMNQAFSAGRPYLDLSGAATTSGQNINAGYRSLFVGAVQAIRNPSAHDQMAVLTEDEAFEQLCLASLLMRRLDQATRPPDAV